jgi:hypothetical protein
MTPPAERGNSTKYGFWLETKEIHLFRYVRSLICVAGVTMQGTERGLIDIDDDYDPDEAWHYIRQEIEEEAQVVTLDKIWKDAMQWL